MVLRFFSLSFLGLGVFILMQVLMPVVSYTVWEWGNYQKETLLYDPSPQRKGLVLGVEIENIGNFPAFKMARKESARLYDEFVINVPSIGLNGEKVMVESNDFDQNLAHLPGTALPGQKGNVFITGHSALTRLIGSSTKPIFASLQKVEKGDVIEVKALGQRFNYEVVGLKVVDPKEVSVINPPDSVGRYLTLMTCVPPGVNTKRLIVLAKLR